MRSGVFNFTAAQVSYKASEDATDPQVNLGLVTVTVDFPIPCFLHLELRPIALAETCRFLEIQSLEFQEIWQTNRSETYVNDLSRKF